MRYIQQCTYLLYMFERFVDNKFDMRKFPGSVRAVGRGMLVQLLVGGILFLPLYANADVAEKAGRIVAAWDEWTATNKIKSASLAVFHKGELVITNTKNRDPEKPYPVASLSKTITGICVLQFLEDSTFNLKSTLGDVLGDRLSDKKIRQAETKSSLTIGMLLNQTTGLKKDVTQENGLSKYNDFTNTHMESVAIRSLQPKVKAKPGQNFFYNNGNFAILGWIIEVISGKPYEQACLDKTLKPVGIASASLNPQWRVMSSWGGWVISAIDYGKFIDAYFTDQKVLGKPPIRYGRGVVRDNIKYGAGYYWRDVRKGYNFWHYGRWKWGDVKRRANFGAVFWHLSPGWTISGNYGLSPRKSQTKALDQAIYAALAD